MDKPIIPDLSLGLEWALLELIVLGIKHEEETAYFNELINSPDMDWGELIDQAIRHKILPLVASTFAGKDLVDKIPQNIYRFLHKERYTNTHKIDLFRKETARLISAFKQIGVNLVGLKGICFESTIYEGQNGRNLNDIDLLVDLKHRESIINTMLEFNYQHGHFNWETSGLMPMSRKSELTYALNPDHIPPFILLSQNPVIKYIKVDFSTNLSWTNASVSIPLKDALSKLNYQPIPGVPNTSLPTLTPEFQFIYTILHLYREAIQEQPLLEGDDVNLMKFGDVIRLWNKYQHIFSTQSFRDLIDQYEISEPISWVLTHIDRTFGLETMGKLALDYQISETLLAGARSPGGGLKKWEGTMRDRLASKDRIKLFSLA